MTRIGPTLLLVGASGNALELLETAERTHRVLGVLDEGAGQDTAFHGLPVWPFSGLARFPEAELLFTVGSTRSFRARRAILGRLRAARDRFATIVDPGAAVSRFAEIGRGVALSRGAIVTSNGRIGDHVLVMPQSVIHHDVIIGAFSLIGAHVTIAGGARIGDSVYVGSASAIRDGVSVGDGALIGMGSNVVRDVPDGAVVAGNPARVLRMAEDS